MSPELLFCNHRHKEARCSHRTWFPQREVEVDPNQVRAAKLCVDTSAVTIHTNWHCIKGHPLCPVLTVLGMKFPVVPQACRWNLESSVLKQEVCYRMRVHDRPGLQLKFVNTVVQVCIFDGEQDLFNCLAWSVEYVTDHVQPEPSIDYRDRA